MSIRPAAVIDPELLASDRERVHSARREDVIEALQARQATVEQAREWYYTEDPLREDLRESKLLSLINPPLQGEKHDAEGLQNFLRVNYAHEGLALTLLAHVIKPGDESTLDDSRQRLANTVESFVLQPYETSPIMQWMKNQLPKEPTAQQLKDLYMTLDSLNVSMRTYTNIATGWIQEFVDPNSTEGKALVQSATNKAWNYKNLTMLVGEYIQQKGKALAGNNSEVAKIGFQAGLFLASYVIESGKAWHKRDGTEESAEKREFLFRTGMGSVVDLMRKRFLYEGSPKVIKDEEAKGELYEALFFLDGNFALHTTPGLTDWSVTPTFLRLDRPMINRPKQRRGFDASVHNNQRTFAVQLKSGNEEDKENPPEFHPNILELFEPKGHFPHVDYRTLSAHLARYERWLNNGCRDEDAAAIRKSALKSSADVVAHTAKITNQSELEFLLGKMPGMVLTRAQRRRAERALGTLISKKAKKRSR